MMRTKQKAKQSSELKVRIHYTEDYIINPAHPVTINVIGCGGTGSQVISSLLRMHLALCGLGHPGLYVRAIDPKRVTEANMGRQLFFPSDVDSYKSITLIGRINRSFGLDWEGFPESYTPKSKIPKANITISCVDSGPGRKGIKEAIWEESSKKYWTQPYERPYYWMDFGNMQDRGQVVIGTVSPVIQDAKSEYTCVETLPTIDALHPDIFLPGKEDEQGPSCSLAEALSKQDLFINSDLANMGLTILWKMFREARTQFHGCYVNLTTMVVNPIKV